MAQAKTGYSTPMPAVSTRRRFLSQAAGVAAGGTVLALAPARRGAAPGRRSGFWRRSNEDYRAAAKVVEAAASEVSRREEMLMEEGLGQYPVICVLDATCRRGKPEQTMIYTHDQIDRHLPPDRFSKANAEARASLDAKIERHKAVMGDSEDILYAAQDAETEALDILVWTQPTTVAGTLALLELWPDLRQARIDYDHADSVMISAVEALRDIQRVMGNVTLV